MSGFETYSTPQKLSELLNTLVKQRSLPTHRGKIARTLIEKEYGFEHCSLSNYHNLKKHEWAKNTVDKFESDLIQQETEIAGINTEFGTPSRFKRLLESLRSNTEEIPLSPQGENAGHINRRIFAEKYNLPQSALTKNATLWQWMRTMLDNFDDELYEDCTIGTVWERKVPEIRNYLEQVAETKQLPINEHGRLNRRAVMGHFGMPSNQSTSVAETRAPKMQQLFKEYDEIISQQCYSQYAGDKHKDALRQILNKRVLVLDSSLRQISFKWLAQELRTEKSIIRSSPNLMALIEQRTKAIHETQHRGTTTKSFNLYGAASINLGATPFSVKHNRVYSFSSLIEFYNLRFAEQVGTTFIAICNKGATGTAKGKYQRLLHFFTWIANPENIDSNVASLLRENKKPNQVDFSRTCMAYRAALLIKSPKTNTNTSIITQFGEAKVIPKYTFLPTSRVNKDKSHKQSILEASLKKDETELVKNVLTDAANYRGINISQGKDTKAFLETLMFEKSNNPDLPEDLSQAMVEITASRLLEIRIQASRVFEKWQSAHQKGHKLVASATVNCEEFRSRLHQRKTSSGLWSEYIKDVFPIEDSQVALANLLAIIKKNYDGCPPNNKNTGMQFWSKKYQLFGGIEQVASYLVPTSEALSSVLMLYLCESGANNAVALSLDRCCIHKSEVAQHRKVVGRKDKALGKPIYVDLKIKSENKQCVSAIGGLEYLCSTQVGDDSLQYYQNGKLQPLTEFTFRAAFKAICDQSDYLKQFNLVPSMLRPTVLLNVQLKDPTNLGVAQMIAHHESGSTTGGYTNKLPHRIQMESDMLEFQQTIEVVILNDDKDAHTKLDIDESEWKAKRKKAVKTGWGVYCKDRELVTESGEKVQCVEVENCVKCRHKRMLVSADPESISDMIIWKISLENNQTDFTSKNMNRWTDTWVPWQAFYSVVLEEKMVRGKLSLIKKQATEIANRKMNDNNFVMPRPW
jgi:hypothetical protein